MGMAEDTIRGAEVLLQPLRYRIVEALEEAPEGLYINELAKNLGEERQLVAFHLLTLASHGFVEGEYKIAEKPASRGRAVKVYRLTDKVKQIFRALEKELEAKLDISG